MCCFAVFAAVPVLCGLTLGWPFKQGCDRVSAHSLLIGMLQLGAACQVPAANTKASLTADMAPLKAPFRVVPLGCFLALWMHPQTSEQAEVFVGFGSAVAA
jgi:hypothetical protein